MRRAKRPESSPGFGGEAPIVMRTLALVACCACGSAQTSVTPPLVTNQPFGNAHLYVDPDYVKLAHGVTFPTAVWLDTIERTRVVSRVLDDAKTQNAVVTFVLYDLPNRDCSAKSSAGELAVEARGEERYKAEFIDAIATQFRAHASQRIAAIIEPDSLANVATNLENPKCAASEKVYRHSIAYAIATLSLPNVALYLDAAHAGWLGWDANRAKIGVVFKEVLADAGGAEKIRGFALNVSNYDVADGEIAYAHKLDATLAGLGIHDKRFVIDTSRSGVAKARTKDGNWCNVKGAGLGPRPVVDPAPLVDAFLWVKPPGQSDGTSDASAPRFDANCSSEDAMPNAPEAGQWFAAYFSELVKNANPPL
jgi:cellulose 1,4-beta-cellobiosidase